METEFADEAAAGAEETLAPIGDRKPAFAGAERPDRRRRWLG
jgi:hypothetical protein